MHPLETLDFPTQVAKRAQYEAFEFTLTTDGVVVRNGSHPDPSDHEYLVTVDDGIPAACECPADERFNGACKHRVAVAIRRPLLDAVAANASPVIADGGQADADTPATVDPDGTADPTPEDGAEATSDDCTDCLPDFPCWECVRTSRKQLPD